MATSKLASAPAANTEHWGQDRPGDARSLAYLDMHEPTDATSVLFSVLEPHTITQASPVHAWPRSAKWTERVRPRGWGSSPLAMPRVTATWTDAQGVSHRASEHEIVVVCLGTDATPARQAEFQAVLLRDPAAASSVQFRVEGLDGVSRDIGRQP